MKDALQVLDALLEAGADPRLPGTDGKDAGALARQLKAPRAFLERLEAAGNACGRGPLAAACLVRFGTPLGLPAQRPPCISIFQQPVEQGRAGANS